jgi:cytochrome c oxidase cbb3-type subunit III
MKFFGQIFTLLVITMSTTLTFAQDGEGLFKSKCNMCHMLGKDGTGPNLKGVKQKWEDAGEGELIYEWVANSQALVLSGKSSLANAAKEYSPTDMPAQQVSNEELDAILSYVDNWVPAAPAAEVAPSTSTDPVVVIVPNYKKNLNLFYFLMAGILLQIIAILILSGTTKTIVKMQQIKNAAKDTTVKAIIALVGMFGFIAMSNQSLALEFQTTGEGAEGTPWLLVEDSDIMMLIGLNVVLLFIIFYMRRMFNEVMEMVRPRPVKEVVNTKKQESKLNKILTDAVPIEEEYSILLSHEYDGIQELDNNLPPWWVWGFYATIVFAVIYLGYYHVFSVGDLQIAEYNRSVAEAEVEVKAYLEKNAMNVDETNVTLLTESKDLATGKTLYDANCVICHNPKGEGNIGPNLTDNTWIYGYDVKEVFATVKNGTANGMPEHASKLNPVQLQQVASYVISMPEAEGKQPEGDIIEK